MLIGCWQIEVLNTYLFLTAKPVIYLVNLSAKDYSRKKNKWFVAAAAAVLCSCRDATQAGQDQGVDRCARAQSHHHSVQRRV